MIRAIIDIGTNSSLLLIGSLSKNNQVNCDLQKFIVTRLGEGISESKTIKFEAMQRTIGALEEYDTIIKDLQVERVHVLGTEALRQAKNSDEFKRLIVSKFGWDLQIINASEEAKFSYIGALDSASQSASQKFVVDVGGGSTELILGKNEAILFSSSIPLGVVTLAENYRMKEQLSKEDITQIESQVDTQLSSQNFFKNIDQTVTMIGVGGTITTLVAIKEKIKRYDPAKINGFVIDVYTIEKLFNYLNQLTLEQRRNLPGLVKGREDVILYGTLIFLSIMRKTKQNTIVASDRGLRWGYLKWMELKG